MRTSISRRVGGTEGKTAEMFLRMYLRWSEAKGFKAELVEVSGGEVAGIKRRHCTFKASLLMAAHRNWGAPSGKEIPLILVTDATHLSHRFSFLLR